MGKLKDTMIGDPHWEEQWDNTPSEPMEEFLYDHEVVLDDGTIWDLAFEPDFDVLGEDENGEPVFRKRNHTIN